jgi:DNA-binding HxlR family transcriptional regulator
MKEEAVTGSAEARDDAIFKRSSCPITNGLNIFGDKWTLLVIRDLVLGKRRYADFISSPENIASNILSDRLKRLEAVGLVCRQAYQQKPVRYEYVLTEKGSDLKPILEAISRWGKKHCPGTDVFRPVDQPALRVSKTGSTNSDFND